MKAKFADKREPVFVEFGPMTALDTFRVHLDPECEVFVRCWQGYAMSLTDGSLRAANFFENKKLISVYASVEPEFKDKVKAQFTGIEKSQGFKAPQGSVLLDSKPYNQSEEGNEVWLGPIGEEGLQVFMIKGDDGKWRQV